MNTNDPLETSIFRSLIKRFRYGASNVIDKRIRKQLTEYFMNPYTWFLLTSIIALLLILAMKVRVDSIARNPIIIDNEIQEFKPNPNYNKNEVISDKDLSS